MKATFTLIIAGLMAVSVTSHSANSRIKSDNNPVFKHSVHGFGNKEASVIDNRKDHRFRVGTKSNDYLKSALSTKQKLDYMIYEDFDESTNQWEKEKDEFQYNNNGEVLQSAYYTWNVSLNQWINDGKEDYTYNANGNMTQWMYSYLDENTGNLVGSDKEEYIYDANWNQTQSISYNWDNTSGKWIASSKYENTYNASGKKTLEINSRWDENSGKWDVSWKYEYNYNSNGDKTLSIDYSWEEFTKQWSANSKNEYTYDANKNMTLEIDYSNNGANQWIGTRKYALTYNPNGNILQTDYNWDELSGAWQSTERHDYLRDTYGNISNENYYEWDLTASQWVATEKDEYSFNNNYSINEMVWPFREYEYGFSEYYQEEFKHMLTEFKGYGWDKTNIQWYLYEKTMLYYSPVNITGVENISKNEVKTYPNPATEYVVFELKDASQPATIELTDIQGKKVIAQLLLDSKQIVVRQLKSGMYFYTVNQNERIYKGKVVKQ